MTNRSLVCKTFPTMTGIMLWRYHHYVMLVSGHVLQFTKELTCYFVHCHRTRKGFPQINSGWYSLASSWRMDAHWLTTTSKRSRLFIWSSGLGVEPWSRSKLSLGKRSRSTSNPLTRLTGSRSVLKRKKVFLPCSKGTLQILVISTSATICSSKCLFYLKPIMLSWHLMLMKRFLSPLQAHLCW